MSWRGSRTRSRCRGSSSRMRGGDEEEETRQWFELTWPRSPRAESTLRRLRTNSNSLSSNLALCKLAHYCAKYYLYFGIQGHFSRNPRSDFPSPRSRPVLITDCPIIHRPDPTPGTQHTRTFIPLLLEIRSSIPEEWANERERLTSECESKVKTSRPTSVPQLRNLLLGYRVWRCCNVTSSNNNNEVGGIGSGLGMLWRSTGRGFITPPNPRSLGTELNRPRRRKITSSSRATGRPTARGGGEVVVPIDRGAEDKSGTTSTHLLSADHTPFPSLVTLMIPTPISTHFEVLDYEIAFLEGRGRW